MNQQPLVSVALCVYNGERYLDLQLNSILTQDYQNIEVIAVDDCSTDGSAAILRSYADRFNNLKIYSNEVNLGYVKNFEKAINLCNGKYIALADQDDIWYPEKISTQVAAIGNNILIYHDSEFVDKEGKSLNQKVSDRLNLYQGNSPLPFVLMNSASGHSMMFDRALINYALPFDPFFFHDWQLVFAAANLGSIKAIPQVLVKYRQHNSNTVNLRNSAAKPVNELLSKKNWVGYCSRYNGPYRQYITRLYHLIRPDISWFEKIELFYLLAKHRKQLYAINKTPVKKQLNMLRKLVFRIGRK